MKTSLIILWLLVPIVIWSQAIDSALRSKKDTGNDSYKSSQAKPELLTSGFIDVVANGQVNASARLIRLYIGEPTGITIPLTIYSGVSANNFQSQQGGNSQLMNEQLSNNLINPLSGLGNIAINDIFFFNRKKIRLTRTGLLYHAGERILTGYRIAPGTDPSAARPVNFLSSIGVAGFYIQTGAWEKNNIEDMGISWIVIRYIVCSGSTKRLREIFSGLHNNRAYSGWSLAWGIAITDLLDVKIIYYKYMQAPGIDASLSSYQFSFSYSIRR